MLKKGIKSLLLMLVIFCMLSVNVSAKESRIMEGNKIEYISPAEMQELIERIEAGEEISTRDIGVSYLKMTAAREGNYCKVVFMNTSRLDPVDSIVGTLRLTTASGQVVASKSVKDYQLLYGVARVYEVHPVGGNFSKLLYNLTITEDGLSMPHIGEITL